MLGTRHPGRARGGVRPLDQNCAHGDHRPGREGDRDLGGDRLELPLLFRLKGQEGASCEPDSSPPQPVDRTASNRYDLPPGRGRTFPLEPPPLTSPPCERSRKDRPTRRVGRSDFPPLENPPAEVSRRGVSPWRLLAREPIASLSPPRCANLGHQRGGVAKYGDLAIEVALDKIESQPQTPYSWGYVITIAAEQKPGVLPRRLQPPAVPTSGVQPSTRLVDESPAPSTDAEIAETVAMAELPGRLGKYIRDAILRDIRLGRLDPLRVPEKFRQGAPEPVASRQRTGWGPCPANITPSRVESPARASQLYIIRQMTPTENAQVSLARADASTSGRIRDLPTPRVDEDRWADDDQSVVEASQLASGMLEVIYVPHKNVSIHETGRTFNSLSPCEVAPRGPTGHAGRQQNAKSTRPSDSQSAGFRSHSGTFDSPNSSQLPTEFPPCRRRSPESRPRFSVLNEPPIQSEGTLRQMRQVLRGFAELPALNHRRPRADPCPPGSAYPPTSPARAASLLRSLSSACTYAVAAGYISASPFHFRRVNQWVRDHVHLAPRAAPNAATSNASGPLSAASSSTSTARPAVDRGKQGGF